MAENVFISRVRLQHYKSIARCDVLLGSLNFLVGRNGAGKSNFIDSLRFIKEALERTLDQAIRDRGGINEVRRRSTGHPYHVQIRLDFNLGSTSGHFAVEIAARGKGVYEVRREQCKISDSKEPVGEVSFYTVSSGRVVNSSMGPNPPAASRDRLYLVNASGVPAFRALYDALSRMGFYNLNPDQMRELQAPDTGEVLARDGSNIASVLDRMPVDSRDRLREFLSEVVPGIRDVSHKLLGHKETVEFLQVVKGAAHPWRFAAASMSDGTLRALAILIALFQGDANAVVPFVAIEEPETALHPGAVSLLRDALREAADHTQVVVTSHSPDLLDDRDIDEQSIHAVSGVQGVTQIGPIDAESRSVLRDGLYTAGELMRMNQLGDSMSSLFDDKLTEKLDLFDDGASSP